MNVDRGDLSSLFSILSGVTLGPYSVSECVSATGWFSVGWKCFSWYACVSGTFTVSGTDWL